MQGDEDTSEVSASEMLQIGEKASQGVLGAWLEQLWDWGSGNEGGGVPTTGRACKGISSTRIGVACAGGCLLRGQVGLSGKAQGVRGGGIPHEKS